MKLAIVGSRSYTDKNKIKSLIGLYLEKYPSLVIISGGCPTGADFLAKQIALESNIPYQEFPPAHQKHNSYCALPPTSYNKPYKVSNYFERNELIAENCDRLAAFIVKGIKANGTMFTYNKAVELGKVTHLISTLG